MAKYYSSKKIRKLNAIYNMIMGQRSNGKTYDWVEDVLNNYSKYGDRGAYIRRYDAEIAPKNLTKLIEPHNIEKITNGKWNSFEYKKNQFILCIRVDGEIVARDEQSFMDVYALNTWETSKGADRGVVKSICFDEFMTRKAYLKDEFVIFTQVLSSIIRDRDDVKIFMLANTVNKYCPYFEEMGLYNVENMKPGDIELYDFGTSGLTIAVELCAESENTKKVKKFFAFDNPQLEMITTGKWEIALYPKSPCKFTNDDILKRFYINFNNKIVAGDIIKTSSHFFIFYYYYTGDHEIDNEDIVYLQKHDGAIMHCKHLSDAPTEYHKLIAKLINDEREFYSNNEVGEVVRNWKLNALR